MNGYHLLAWIVIFVTLLWLYHNHFDQRQKRMNGMHPGSSPGHPRSPATLPVASERKTRWT